jgi:SAM-dependent methyltransferase/uncharacterized protein YbaR (Trm112 family)
MKENVVSYFACPNRVGAGACRNELALEAVFSFFKSEKKEIKEGYLKCKACGMRFPVFFGIPVLIADLAGYLRANFYIILELSKRYGRLNKGLVADALLTVKKAKPKDKSELFVYTKKQYAQILKAACENKYIISHYDNIAALAKPDEPLYDFLNRYENETPHRALEDFLKAYTYNNDALTLEVGCNVGGFLSALSNKSRFVFGLDNSFVHLFFASCLLRHLPKRIKYYKVIIEGGIKKKRTLDVRMTDNLTLIAGRGDNLPFKNSSLSIASSCNLIDIIDNPLGLLEEKIRVLKKRGLLFSSDPYEFLGENKKMLKLKRNQTPWQRIQEVLRPRIKILEERHFVPWITRGYQRSYSIYYNHSFCGRKMR